MTASFVCPDCGAESFHPEDIRFRYCGRCRAFKGETDWREVASRAPEDHAAMARLSIERPQRETQEKEQS